jgi:hypothetical protein
MATKKSHSKSKERATSSHSVYKKEQSRFHNARSEKKLKRQRFLAENPEARIEIDTQELYQILQIDYVMKCARDSSVARGQAIQGSDIDGAVIITEKEVPPDTQDRITSSLKAKGFSVTYPHEVQKAEELVNKTIIGTESLEASINTAVINANQVKFYTLHEIKSTANQLKIRDTVFTGKIIAQYGKDLIIKRR